jgi:multicomponent K+:H+ antiporter subunit D
VTPVPEHWLIAPVLLPLVGAALQLGSERFWPAAQRPLALVLTGALALLALRLLAVADSGAVSVYLVGNWAAPFGIALALDRLSAIMLALTGVVAIGVVAASLERAHDAPHFHVFFQVQLAGLNGAFLTADLFNLFVFFEVLLAASYALLLHGAGGRGVRAGLHYVVVNLVASMMFLVAASLLYGVTGTLNFADLAQRLAAASSATDGLAHAAVFLLLVVFGVKAAVLPLGFWLPETYACAPPSVAALFAIMTKVGIYAMVRTVTLFAAAGGALPSWTNKVLLASGLATIGAGAVGAFVSDRQLRLTAYLVLVSTGTLVAALAFGAPALPGLLYYLVHSTIAVALMFLLAHAIAAQRGPAADRFAVGPPVADARLLQLLFLGAAMAIIGLPPLSGFIGKMQLLGATLARPWWGVYWAMLLASGLACLYSLAVAGSRLFWRVEGAVAGPPMRALDRFALLWFAAAALALAIGAGPATRYAAAAAAQLAVPGTYVDAVLRQAPLPHPPTGAAR